MDKVIRSVLISNKYTSDLVFKYVGIWHRVLGIKAIRGHDICTLEQCVIHRDNNKFKDFFARLYINNPDGRQCLLGALDLEHKERPYEDGPSINLLASIRRSFMECLMSGNHDLADYIIDQLRIAIQEYINDDPKPQTKAHTMGVIMENILLSFHYRVDLNGVALSRRMISTLLNIPVNSKSLSRCIAFAMASSALAVNRDLSLLKLVMSRFSDKAWMVDELLDKGGNGGQRARSVHSSFFEEETSDSLIELIKYYTQLCTSPLLECACIELIHLALAHHRYDVVEYLVKEYGNDIVLDSSDYHQAMATYANTDLLVKLNYVLPHKNHHSYYLNSCATNGNISFLNYISDQLLKLVFTPNRSVQLTRDLQLMLNKYLLGDALASGHVDCANFILDNWSEALAHLDNGEHTDNRWIVSGMSLEGLGDWIAIIDKLVGSPQRVSCTFFDLYSNAIKAKRMDIIEHIEPLIVESFDGDMEMSIDVDRAMKRAIVESNTEAITTLLRIRPSIGSFTINLADLALAELSTQHTLLSQATPGQLTLVIPVISRFKVGNLLTIDTMSMVIKYEHYLYVSQGNRIDLIILAACLDFELLVVLYNPQVPNKSNLSIIAELNPDIRVIKFLEQQGIGFSLSGALKSAMHKDYRDTVEHLLNSAQHLKRTDHKEGCVTTSGRFLESDLYSIFNRSSPSYNEDSLTLDMIVFIWTRLNDKTKRSQVFINELLRTSDAGTIYNVYRVIIDKYFGDDDHHVAQPLIEPPQSDYIVTALKKTPNITSSIDCIIKLFRPDTTLDPNIRDHSIIIRYSQDQFKALQRVLVKNGIVLNSSA
ncbi:hypothetical protein SAMD00019534_029680 [Acytostelium subglobosum LB1]|uniref:hypothetical protein n=1 Tax=Acytostelium subglobosum LB1 TaxID=1410327 RepID=UPI0006448688|nr:hypothetical protein SAMD00019534_029680 [Acytostelium subglobosum LB1]GAM19793.1 hypothetical protein SAMD00019534_029680 [Acytostelium subglobosum LB1]|eukprot:XP_012756555.1 hypothetical protein SAMD00019534_029680 [Acytostelium subglobosum LB1]